MSEATEPKPDAGLFMGDKWELPSILELKPTIESETKKRLEKAGWSEDDIQCMLMGLGDAVSNAIVHGNFDVHDKDKLHPGEKWGELIKRLGLETSKKVKIFLNISADVVRITIQDEGKGFDPKETEVPDPTDPENILKFTGRGVFMMQSFFDEVLFDKSNKSVTLVKRKPNT